MTWCRARTCPRSLAYACSRLRACTGARITRPVVLPPALLQAGLLSCGTWDVSTDRVAAAPPAPHTNATTSRPHRFFCVDFTDVFARFKHGQRGRATHCGGSAWGGLGGGVRQRRVPRRGRQANKRSPTPCPRAGPGGHVTWPKLG